MTTKDENVQRYSFERETEIQRAKDAIREAEFACWSAFLAANGKGNDTFTRIQSLGGYKIAKSLYLAVRQ